MNNYDTFKDAGYTPYAYYPETQEHILQNDDGELERWVANKNHASYGLIYKNTHLEFSGDY